MRGGTSKGLFVRERDLPPAGPERDDLLLRLMGTPDPLQIDGMGGSTSSTSKVMVIGEPEPGGVVPYSFAQIGIGDAVVDWRGNCGNLTFAVAAFVVDEGIITADPTAHTVTVSLRNENTGVRIDAEVEVHNGRTATHGTTEIAGVPGTSGAITTKYLAPAGAALGALLPLGAAVTSLEVDSLGGADAVPVITSGIPIVGHGLLTVREQPRGRLVEVSLVDATNPYLFIARDAVPGADRPASELRADREFLEAVERIRASAAVACGTASSPDAARIEAPVTPRIVLVSPGTDGADIDAVTVSMQQVHRGIPMTGAMCLAAARAVPGTIVERIAGVAPDGVTVIRQPLGLTRVTAEATGAEVRRADASEAPVEAADPTLAPASSSVEVAGHARDSAPSRAVHATSSGGDAGIGAKHATSTGVGAGAPGVGAVALGVGAAGAEAIRVESVGITGTARALMRGEVFPRPAEGDFV